MVICHQNVLLFCSFLEKHVVDKTNTYNIEWIYGKIF